MSYSKLLLTILGLLVIGSNGCLVQTNTGLVHGKLVAYGNVEAYLGIPYAEPPLGHLRFSKPIPKMPWQAVYDATRFSPACMQVKMKGVPYAPDGDYMSENCLYLNVWVPRSNGTDVLKPIMLFIYGGAFVIGASNIPLYNGDKLAEHGDVIVVTINYRVGGLGFFTDFTDDAPGSVGMYDQVLAIKWIKQNAKNFNGDPENIVLFGESAGSVSIAFHQISPLSRNLIKRAILQSGSAVHPAYDDNNVELKKISREYADHVGCKHNDLNNSQKDVVKCLRKVPAEKFSEIDLEIYLMRSKFPLLRIGNDFLPESPIDAFRKGYFKNSEVLMGITRDEGSILLNGQRPDLFGQFGEKVTASMFNETTTYHFIKTSILNGDLNAVDKIIRSYIDDVNNDKKYTYLKAAIEAIGDYLISCGNVFQAEYQSLRGNPVFFYVFDHRPASSPFAEWIGVAHFDEVQFVFGNPMHKYFTEYEKKLSKEIIDMWSTFAKTGYPAILGWLKYTRQHPNYFIIGKQDSVGLRPDHYRCERWRNLYRSVIDEDLIEALKQRS